MPLSNIGCSRTTMVPYVAGGVAGQRTETAVMMAKGGKDKVKTGKVAENREARFQYEVLNAHPFSTRLCAML